MNRLASLASTQKPNPLVFDELFSSRIHVVKIDNPNLTQHVNLHDLPIVELMVHPDILCEHLLYQGVLYDPCFGPEFPTIFSRHEDYYGINGFINSSCLKFLSSSNSSLVHVCRDFDSGILPIVGKAYSLQDLKIAVSLITYDHHPY